MGSRLAGVPAFYNSLGQPVTGKELVKSFGTIERTVEKLENRTRERSTCLRFQLYETRCNLFTFERIIGTRAGKASANKRHSELRTEEKNVSTSVKRYRALEKISLVNECRVLCGKRRTVARKEDDTVAGEARQARWRVKRLQRMAGGCGRMEEGWSARLTPLEPSSSSPCPSCRHPPASSWPSSPGRFSTAPKRRGQ